MLQFLVDESKCTVHAFNYLSCPSKLTLRYLDVSGEICFGELQGRHGVFQPVGGEGHYHPSHRMFLILLSH